MKSLPGLQARVGAALTSDVCSRSDAAGSQDEAGFRAARGGRTASPPLRVPGAVRKARVQPSKGRGDGIGGDGGAAKRAMPADGGAAGHMLSPEGRSNDGSEEEPDGSAATADGADEDAAMAEAAPAATPEAAIAMAEAAGAAKQARDDKRVYDLAVKKVRAGPAYDHLGASARI